MHDGPRDTDVFIIAIKVTKHDDSSFFPPEPICGSCQADRLLLIERVRLSGCWAAGVIVPPLRRTVGLRHLDDRTTGHTYRVGISVFTTSGKDGLIAMTRPGDSVVTRCQSHARKRTQPGPAPSVARVIEMPTVFIHSHDMRQHTPMGIKRACCSCVEQWPRTRPVPHVIYRCSRDTNSLLSFVIAAGIEQAVCVLVSYHPRVHATRGIEFSFTW